MSQRTTEAFRGRVDRHALLRLDVVDVVDAEVRGPVHERGRAEASGSWSRQRPTSSCAAYSVPSAWSTVTPSSWGSTPGSSQGIQVVPSGKRKLARQVEVLHVGVAEPASLSTIRAVAIVVAPSWVTTA